MLIFQAIDIDHVYQNNQLIMRIFGVNAKGESVCCHVYHFQPYFYVYGSPYPSFLLSQAGIVAVESVKKTNIMNYLKEEPDHNFIRITVTKPNLVYYFARQLEDRRYKIFEANIDVEIRFMVDTGLTGGCCWLECASWIHTVPKKSFCQWEVDTEKDFIVAHQPEGEWASIAPFTILSFDIECAGRKGIFPEPQRDPVIQIGNVVNDNEKVIFTLDRCESIPGARVVCFDDERLMLEAWAAYVRREADPDVLTGYNINTFDLPYLIRRAEHLGSEEGLNLSRIRGGKSVIVKEDSTFVSRQEGARQTVLVNTEGRCQFDMMTFVRREYKLRSYTLNAVAYHFLGEQKGDVHHSIIADLQAGNPQTRRKLAEYCLKDAHLPLLLMKRLMAFVRYAEMARVTGIPLSFVIERGQQIKIVAQLLRVATARDLILPSKKRRHEEEEEDYYEGATVIEPRRGYYNSPIVILDFASLYPSIMIAHNLCYTTLWNGETPPPSYVKTTPSGDRFVQREKGLLPEILESLISARKKAKQDLKNETDSVKKEVLDGRQLALKISANSVYGFTGALRYGKLPCKEISRSVTAYGREMIAFTREKIEEKYPGSRVIYGDTDSVMIQFAADVTTLPAAIEKGKEAAAYVSGQFPPPIKLEFEKVYFPFLLINKKRYAALSFSNVDAKGVLDYKGIEVVRRDNCRLVSEVMNACLGKILIDRRPDRAVSYVKSIVSDLLCDRIDVSRLIITKELSKKVYKNKNIPHIVLAEKKKKRGDKIPQLGERIPYVIVTGMKGSRAYERAEDPIYALDRNIPLDYDYYLNNQLRKPLFRIFEPILGVRKSNELFEGEHTRVRVKGSFKWGPMSRFVTSKRACVGCRIPLKEENKKLCAYCQPNEIELYLKEMEKLRALEKNYARYWTQCQRCQNTINQEITCTNFDCLIFYSRHKTKIELGKQEKLMLDW